jgi:Spy/CpxP family protein refolding chaperone
MKHLLLALFLIGSMALAQPTSQPAGERFRPGMMLESFRDAVAKLDLSDDQKTKVKEILVDAGKELQELREKVAADRSQQPREKVRQIMQQTREKLSGVLSPEQQQKLRELMQQNIQTRMNRPEATDRSRRAPEKKPDDKPAKMDEPAQQMDMMDGMEKKVGGPSPRPARMEMPNSPGPGAGETAPDFKVQKIDGSTVQLAGFKGKVLVLTFGSYTCPAYRDRVAPMEEFKKLAGPYVSFLTIYTKEAHPQGVWEVERNKDENIAFPQTTDLKARESMARLAKDKLGLSGTIGMDSIDDAMIKAYGGFPNGTVVIGRDGKIVGRQTWTDPSGLKRLIDEALATKPSTQPAR